VASLPAAQVFLALGEPTRWAIVHYLLAREQAFAGELQRVVGRKSSTASRHLQVLHELGVTRRVMDAGEDERRVCYAIRPEWRVPGEPRTLEFGTVRVRFAAPAARRPPGAGTARRAV
jgi:DNA-binding transcriptional ArsR family regulator